MLRLIRAIAAGCKAEPALNAWYDSRAVGRRVLESIHLGVAVDTPTGYSSRAARRRPPHARGPALRASSGCGTTCAARTIPPEELRGYTFILSNFGTFGGRYANPDRPTADRRDPRRRPRARRGRRRRRQARGPSDLAAVADDRSPRRYRRRGDAVSRCSHRGSRIELNGATHGRLSTSISVSTTSSRCCASRSGASRRSASRRSRPRSTHESLPARALARARRARACSASRSTEARRCRLSAISAKCSPSRS